MTALQPGRKITLLVWALVMIGLLAGVATNGLVGWTLHSLNLERQSLTEQESHLSAGAEQLRQLSRQAQTAITDLLRLDPGSANESYPVQGFIDLAADLQGTNLPDLKLFSAELGQHSYNLEQLWQQVLSWQKSYRPIYHDSLERRSLLVVRGQLQRLRADLEIYEGRQRLQEVLVIRDWRRAGQERAEQLAAELLSYENQAWRRSLDGINNELVDLARMVEILAGADRLDQLADLKDNQIKPSIERLKKELARLKTTGRLSAEQLSDKRLDDLQKALFGEGFTIYQEYQTIRTGRGGLYRHAEQRLQLLQKRELLLQQATDELQQIEALYPPLASLTQKRNRELAQQAERSLTNGALNLFMLSLLTLLGFLGLGGQIIRMTRQQLDALAQLRRQNERILASAGEGILGVDAEGKTIFINPAAEMQLGWNAQELIGHSYRKILADNPATEARDPICRALESGGSHRSDQDSFRHRDGGEIPVACAVSPMQNAARQIEGAVVTFMDISDRKAAEKTLRRYYDRLAEQEKALAELNRDLERKVIERTRELEEKGRQLMETQEELAHAEKLAAIGSLAAGVAHEINNPAAIIRGNVELLEAGLSPHSETREETGEILRQVERISLITSNLLAFARVQNLHSAPFSMAQLLTEILDQIGHQIPTEKTRICFNPPADAPPCYGDAPRLRQVFTNIMINGLQAMAEGGRLQIDMGWNDAWWKIAIRDSGPGIPEEIRTQIFNPFFTTKPNGTGLGLSISYGIIQAHGGEIDIASDLEGACFSVSLPRTTEQHKQYHDDWHS